MADLIDRNKLINWFSAYGLTFVKMIDVIKTVKDADSVDAAPVKHGWWEWFEQWSPSTPDHLAECDDCGWKCSECKTALEDIVNGYYDDPYEVPQLNYCPKCGAKMDGQLEGG